MDKRLYIHIGGPKTGTTALQGFLAQNRQQLQSKGFCYPGTSEAHWGICHNLRVHTVSGIRQRPRTLVRKCLEEIRKSSCHTFIISAECLADHETAAAPLRDLIPPALPVTVVYYARRQDALIESWYNQVVKSSHYRVKEKLDEEFLKSLYPMKLFDHTRVIAPWAESFGKENIIVRCYERQQMNGDIVSDFSGCIGLRPDDSFSPAGQDINTSLDLHHMEFIRLCNRAITDGADINNTLIGMGFSQSRLFETMRKKHLLSPKTRNAILDHYEESNRDVAREYLGRGDGRLFFDPRPDPDEPWEPYRGLTTTELVPIIGEMIAGLDRQQQEMEPLGSMLRRINRTAAKARALIPEAVKRVCRGFAEHPDTPS